MATTTNASRPSAHVVELTRARADRPQPVSVGLSGFQYPGEVIFAEQWQAWFGAGLPERVMFRFVLLSEPQNVAASDISSRFIVVATPRRPDRHDDDLYSKLDRELGRLNEIRERYITTGDYELHSLTESITDQASKARRDLVSALADKWRRSRLVARRDSPAYAVSSESIFVGDEPAAWVDAVAATLFSVSSSQPAGDVRQADPARLFARLADPGIDLKPGHLDSVFKRTAGIELTALFDEIDTLASGSPNRRVSGHVLRDHVMRRLGIPPGLAALGIVAYIRARDGEAAIVARDSTGEARLDSHSLAGAGSDLCLLFAISWLSPEHTGDWNSALPYTSQILPAARPEASGEPAPDEEQQFQQALQVASTRTELTLRALENVCGAVASESDPVRTTARLAPVLQSRHWRSFYEAARREFPDAAEFASAVKTAAQLRILSEDIIDVQSAHDYVAAADFGRIDGELRTSAASLLAMLDVGAILEGRNSVASELQQFSIWKSAYAGAYREHHRDRRSRDLETERQASEADRQLAATEKLAAIPELSGHYDPTLGTRWRELRDIIRPCSVPEDELELQRQPYCTECGIRMGSSGIDTEIQSIIAAIENALHETTNSLSRIATSRVLAGERWVELQKLIDIGAIADLTALSAVLDEDVVAFLERFASDSSADSDQAGAS